MGVGLVRPNLYWCQKMNSNWLCLQWQAIQICAITTGYFHDDDNFHLNEPRPLRISNRGQLGTSFAALAIELMIVQHQAADRTILFLLPRVSLYEKLGSQANILHLLNSMCVRYANLGITLVNCQHICKNWRRRDNVFIIPTSWFPINIPYNAKKNYATLDYIFHHNLFIETVISMCQPLTSIIL